MSYNLTENQNDSTSLQNVQSEVEKQRVMQEVQALVLVAQKCPRDEVKATKRIMEAAKRETLAKNALYVYPRGGENVKGPSIRTAETIAKYWGNLSFGIKELSQDNRNHISEVLAYAWDLETNVRQEKVFKVTHHRYTKSSGNKLLSDPRDIYEKVANDGARRLRACILGLIPTDVVDDFITECEKTIAGNNTKPLKDRILTLIEDFEGVGVTQELIEKRLGVKADKIIEKQYMDLMAIYTSVKDNFQPASAYFDLPKNGDEQINRNPFNETGKKAPVENDSNDEDLTGMCSKCGIGINKKVKDYSEKYFKKPLCRDCQELAKAEKGN